MANGCCGGTTQSQGPGADYCNGVNVKLTRVQIDQKNLKGVDPCVTVFGVKAEITEGPLNQCTETCSWCKWLPWALLGLVVVGLLLWSFLGNPRTSVASATMAPTVATAGQNPVSATATTGDTYVFVGGTSVPGAVQKTASGGAPAKAVIPKAPCNCKAAVFDAGAYHAFGVEVARDGANFAFTQTTGEPASPNDILEAQASKKNGWITVVFDPSGPYAVSSKGTPISTQMDKSGRILVPVSQVQI